MVSRRQRSKRNVENILSEHDRKLEDQQNTKSVANTSESDERLTALEATLNSPSHFQELLQGTGGGGAGQAPGVPNNLRVALNEGYYGAGDVLKSRVTLEWDAASVDPTVDNPEPINADQYEIWSRRVDGGVLMLDTSSASTTAIIESWDPGVPRMVTIRARYGVGLWSQFASEITVIPEAPEIVVPKAPTGLNITKNEGFFTSERVPMSRVTYAWADVTQSTKDTPISVANYQVWERNPSAEWIMSAESDEPTATIEYPAGSVREVRVRALSSMGSYSDYSASLTFTTEAPVATKPLPPTGLRSSDNVGTFQINGRTVSNVTISWTAVTLDVKNNPLPVREYEVVVIEPAGTNGDTYQRPLGRTPATNLRIETPTNVEKKFAVRAQSTSGVWSDISDFIKVTGAQPEQNTSPPTPPVLGTARGTVTVSWDGKLVTGDLPPEYWQTRVQVSYDSGSSWSSLGIPMTGPGMGAVFPATVGSTVHVRLVWVDVLNRLSLESVPTAIIVQGVVDGDVSQEVLDAIDKAQKDALSAKSDAAFALTSADGKNKLYYQNTAPSGLTYKTNDTWFDTSNGHKMYRWSSSGWSPAEFGTNAIADASINNAKIVNLDAAKITTGFLSSNRIDANTISADKLTVASIKDNLVVNGGFEDGLIGWSILTTPPIPDTGAPAGIGGTATVTSTISSEGLRSVVLDRTTSGLATPILTFGQLKDYYIPVSSTAAKKFYVSADVRSEGTVSNGSFNFFVNWYKSDKTTPSSTVSSAVLSSYTITPGKWNIFEGQVEVPTDAAWMQLRFMYSDTNQNLYLDAITAREATGATLIADGAITTNKILAGSVDTVRLAANAVTAEKIAAESIDATHIRSGSITTSHIAADFGASLNLSGNGSINLLVSGTIQDIENLATGTQGELTELKTYYSFTTDGAIITKPNSPYELRLRNNIIEFTENGTPLTWWDEGTMQVTKMKVTEIELGNHKIEKYATGTIIRATASTS